MKKVENNSFNQQWYVYSQATDKQIINGSAPYLYNILPNDNKVCITAKTIYNNTHNSIYSPDTIVTSHPASNLIQGSTLNIQENMIKQNCYPSFQHGQTT
jgi:hypothetical protein